MMADLGVQIDFDPDMTLHTDKRSRKGVYRCMIFIKGDNYYLIDGHGFTPKEAFKDAYQAFRSVIELDGLEGF